jgi:hypothetical protein
MVLFWYMTADEEPFVCSRCGEQIRHKWTVMAPGVVWCDRDDCEAELRQIRRRERREYRKKMFREQKCIYHEDYRSDPCGKPTVPGTVFCKEHLGVKCEKCGKQATGAKGYCSLGVIYTPLCDKCYKKTF